MKMKTFLSVLLLSIVAIGCSLVKTDSSTVKSVCEWDENCKIVSEHTHSMPKKK